MEEPRTREEIDNEFDNVLNEYNDEELGALDHQIIEPGMDLIDEHEFDNILQDFIEHNKDVCKALYNRYHDKNFKTRIMKVVDEEYKSKYYEDEEAIKIYEESLEKEKEKIEELVKKQILLFNERVLKEEAEGILDPIKEETAEDTEEQRWDVESILSTRTNTDNHPGVIKGVVKVRKNPIKIDPKTMAPALDTPYSKEKLKKDRETPFKEDIVSDSDGEGEDMLNEHEIPDLEKMTEKERKKYLRKLNKRQVKKEKKERRVLKKEMKKEFSKEGQKYAKQSNQFQYKNISV